MPLTGQVEESLREAQGCLRNALAFAARNESSYVAKHIADMTANIDSIIDMDKLIDHLEDLR